MKKKFIMRIKIARFDVLKSFEDFRVTLDRGPWLANRNWSRRGHGKRME
jgi:hypothetical protein